MRRIAAVTVGRSDWGIYRPVLRAIQSDAQLELQLVVAGTHFDPRHGTTVEDIEADGFSIDQRVEMLLSTDSPTAVAKSMGLATIGFADAYQRLQPDILLLLGDRFEMHAAAVAAVPAQLPIAHIHGGEVSHGAIDDAFRHAITKYSHLHFPSTEAHARRIVQLGEEPWRVTVSGAPALDNLATTELLNREQLSERLDLPLPERPLAVCYHPVTLQPQLAAEQTRELLAALDRFAIPIVISRPNADSGNTAIVDLLEQFCERRPNARLFDNLGTQGYFSLLSESVAMVGNSSSGIIEAASFHLPVVNVGLRQAGRAQSGNVINVDCCATEIAAGIKRAMSVEFSEQAQRVKNIYGDGNAAARIVDRLKTEPIGERMLIKKFHDLPAAIVDSVAA